MIRRIEHMPLRSCISLRLNLLVFFAVPYLTCASVDGALAQSAPFTSLAEKTSSDNAAADRFGWSVAIDGDTMVAGSFAHSNDKGAAYIYYRNFGGSGAWEQKKELTLSDAQDFDYFGYSVGISGDTIVVGAYSKKTVSGSSAGAIYIYDRNNGGTDNWGLVTQKLSNDLAIGDNFGLAVAISGDRIIATATEHSSGAGRAYIFGRNQGGTNAWGQLAELAASDAAASRIFGLTASIDGSTAVVGSNAGGAYPAVYVYDQSFGGTDAWGQRVKLLPPRTRPNGYSLFGSDGVSISGDNVAVGDHGFSTQNSVGPGAVYVFNRSQGGTNNWGETWENIGNTSGVNFGFGAALHGDFLAVSTGNSDSNKGRFYLYMRHANGSNWGQIGTFSPTDSTLYLGDTATSLALTTGTVVAGSIGSPTTTPLGYAYVLDFTYSPPPPFQSMPEWEPIRELLLD
jgi:FG-GAP repeat